MKMFLMGLMLFASIAAFATKGPFNSAVHKRFNELEQEKVVKVVYDIGVDATSGSAVGLGKYLPTNSVITAVWIFINTQFVDDGAGTISFECEDTDNIMTSSDLTAHADNQFLRIFPYDADINTSADFATAAGISLASNAGQTIASGCEISATYGGATPSAGKLTAIIRYLIL